MLWGYYFVQKSVSFTHFVRHISTRTSCWQAQFQIVEACGGQPVQSLEWLDDDVGSIRDFAGQAPPLHLEGLEAHNLGCDIATQPPCHYWECSSKFWRNDSRNQEVWLCYCVMFHQTLWTLKWFPNLSQSGKKSMFYWEISQTRKSKLGQRSSFSRYWGSFCRYHC